MNLDEPLKPMSWHFFFVEMAGEESLQTLHDKDWKLYVDGYSTKRGVVLA